MRIWKYHGTGNDFVLVEDMDDRLALSPALVAAVCHRRFGVGADGLIRIAPAEGADFFMDYRNADGGVAEMCGNGIRCLARHVHDRGLTRATELRVLTRAGVKAVRIEPREGEAASITVDMGPPAFERGRVPMAGDPDSTFEEQPMTVAGRTYAVTALSMGNPHCVLLLGDEDVDRVAVRHLGPMVEHRPEFPEHTNVEFVQVVDGRIRVRVWERGSGETMACGTGACAALVAASRAGLVDREADVEFPGGLLRVAWQEETGDVFLSGPAVRVFEGELDPGWRSSSAGEPEAAEART